MRESSFLFKKKNEDIGKYDISANNKNKFKSSSIQNCQNKILSNQHYERMNYGRSSGKKEIIIIIMIIMQIWLGKKEI